MLFVDSADKAARFIWCCDAFNIPLVFLADVPGFMIGTAGRAPGHHPPRRQDGHRGVRGHGAQGLGDRAQGLRRRALRDVAARRSSPRRTIALPTAKIAVMGPEAAVNAVFANKIAGDRGRRRARGVRRRAAARCTRPTSTCCASRRELVIDAVVEPEDLRAELIAPPRPRPRARTATSPTAATACPRSEQPASSGCSSLRGHAEGRRLEA